MTLITPSILQQWTQQQMLLASQVDATDANTWHELMTDHGYHGHKPFFIAGTDISYSPSQSVATLTIVRLDQHGGRELVLSQSRFVQVSNPYIPSYLGFREAPIVSQMLGLLEKPVRERIDCLLVDGGGVLHPRKAGFACHVGVEHCIPTIGVSKNMLQVDGLTDAKCRASMAAHLARTDIDVGIGFDVVGNSQCVWAKALITGNAMRKPIYVSVGHKVSLTTAARVVKTLCEYRVPDPIRLADLHSRALLRGQKIDVYKPHLLLQ